MKRAASPSKVSMSFDSSAPSFFNAWLLIFYAMVSHRL